MIITNRWSIQLLIFKIVICILLITFPYLQSPLQAQQKFVLENNITYGKGGDVDLKLDLARPAEGKGPFPALVFIHGGGWSSGSRMQYFSAIEQAANRGYVAVTIEHRLTSETENGKAKYLFPAQIYDVKCAVRWLRANAKRYKIDSDHIGALGWSSGGHLALLLGLTEPSDELEGSSGNLGYSSGVQAVVSFAGFFPDLSSAPSVAAFYIERLLGGTPIEIPKQYKMASPITYVRKNSPPVLSINGDHDGYIPLEQAERLDAKMKEVGAPHTLIVKKNMGHVDFSDDIEVWDFFDRNLKVGR